MKKLLTSAFLFVLLSCTGLMAQDKQIKWSVSPGVAIPTGLYSILLGVGGEVELKGDYPISENVNLTGSLGVGIFSSKSLNFGGGVSSSGKSMTFVPAIVGLDYKIKQLHVGIGLGYANYTVEDSEGGFTFRPQVGFDVTNKILLNLKYTSTSTSFANVNYIGISPVFKF
jgi:hypothetical protein